MDTYFMFPEHLLTGEASRLFPDVRIETPTRRNNFLENLYMTKYYCDRTLKHPSQKVFGDKQEDEEGMELWNQIKETLVPIETFEKDPISNLNKLPFDIQIQVIGHIEDKAIETAKLISELVGIPYRTTCNATHSVTCGFADDGRTFITPLERPWYNILNVAKSFRGNIIISLDESLAQMLEKLVSEPLVHRLARVQFATITGEPTERAVREVLQKVLKERYVPNRSHIIEYVAETPRSGD